MISMCFEFFWGIWVTPLVCFWILFIIFLTPQQHDSQIPRFSDHLYSVAKHMNDFLEKVQNLWNCLFMCTYLFHVLYIQCCMYNSYSMGTVHALFLSIHQLLTEQCTNWIEVCVCVLYIQGTKPCFQFYVVTNSLEHACVVAVCCIL